MFRYLIIWFTFIFALGFSISLWFWQSIYGVLDYFRSLFTKYFSGLWGIMVLGVFVIYMITIIVQTYQNPFLKLFDEFYTCVIIPPAEFGFSFAWTIPKGLYEFLIIRYNDLISALFDCVNAMVSEIADLLGPEFIEFYTGIPFAFFHAVECAYFAPFFVPSAQIPFGVNGLLFGFSASDWCMYEAAAQIVFRFMNYELLRNECTLCKMDPNATCYLRFLPDDAIPPFPPTIKNDVNCTGCVSIDCDFVTCSMYLLSNITQVIQQPLGVNLTDLVTEAIEPTCCVVTDFYKIPFYIFFGLFTECYSFDDAGDLFLDYISHIGDCWIDLFRIFSGNRVVNIFIYIFSIIFDFIQIFIDSYDNLIDCGALSASCFSAYPGTCVLNSTGFATAGLQTCARSFGDCVVNGDDDHDIEPNPIFRFPPFSQILEFAFPGLMVFVDSIVCQFTPLQQCIFGPSIVIHLPQGTFQIASLPDCPSFSFANFDRIQCFFTCLQLRVPLFAPMFQLMNLVLNGIANTFTTIKNFVNTFYGTTRDFCRKAASTIMISCPLPDVHLDMMKEGRKTEYFLEEHYNNWTHLLDSNHVDPNTTCGSLLYTMGEEFPTTNGSLAYYVLFWTCAGFFSTGLTYQSKYETVDMNRLMDLSTVFTEIEEIFRCQYMEMEEEYNMNQFNLQRYLYEANVHVYNLKKNFEIINTEGLNYTITPTVFPPEEKHVEEWALTVRNAKATHNTLMMGIAERLNRIEGVYITKKWYEFYSILNKLDKKLRKSRINSLIAKHSENLTVGDLLPDDNRALSVVKSKLSNLDLELLNTNDPVQYRYLQLEIARAKEQITLDFGSMIVNWLQSIFDRKAAERDMKERLRNRNKETTLIQQIKSGGLQQTKTWVLTKETLQERKNEVLQQWNRFDSMLSSLYKIKDWIDPKGTMVSKITSSEVMKDMSLIRTGHMIKEHITSLDTYDNITKYFSNQMEYTIDDGFMSLQEYKEKISKRDNSSFHVYSMLTGTYNPRRKESFKAGLAPRDLKAGEYMGYWERWKKNIAEEKIRMMTESGIDPDSEEGRNFRLSGVNAALNNFVIDVFEWLINDVFGTISKVFFQTIIKLNLKQILINFVDSFDPLNIVENAGNKILGFFEFLFICNKPEDYDGTNNYKLACLPFLPEALLDWVVPIGSGNQWFPLQLGVVPEQLILEPCINTFNGNSNLFKFKPSNNCGSNDGYPRPRCDSSPQCDYCERNFGTCALIDFNSPIDSFAFVTGLIGPLLQLFYTGVIPASQITRWSLFVLLWIFGLGVSQLITIPYLIYPIILLIYGVSNVFEGLFRGLSGSGSEGGIPYGGIYVILFILSQVFAGWITEVLPQFVVVIIGWGLAATWLINLLIPFRGIREGLRINAWLAAGFEFLENTPNPVLFIPWGSFIDSFKRFDYSIDNVPYADVFCFFLTISNFLIFFVGAFVMIDLINFMYVIFYPFFIFFLGVITSVLGLVKDLGFYESRLRVGNLEESQESIVQIQRNRMNEINMKIKDTRAKLSSIFTPRINNFASVDNTRLMKILTGNYN